MLEQQISLGFANDGEYDWHGGDAFIDDDVQPRQILDLNQNDLRAMSETSIESPRAIIRLHAPLMKPRRKKPHAKVKTGCSTCRQRRVKCDEGRPSCRQCTKGGRECPGYQKPKMWLFETSKHHDFDQNLEMGSLSMSPSTSPFQDAQGWRSFQYYFEVSEPPMARFFASAMMPLLQFNPNALDADNISSLFWTVTFPRLVCSEAVLAKCLLVLVISHEKLQSGKGPFALEPECLEKSGEAITLLRKEWNNISVDCILLASLLLALAELSYGPSPSGLSHLYAGNKIIAQRRARPEHYAHHRSSPEIDGIRETTELFYEAFFAQIGRNKAAMRPKDGVQPPKPSITRFWLPPKFNSTQQALGSLDAIMTTSQAVMHGKFGELESGDKSNLRNNAEKWLVGFQDLEAELNCTTDPEFLKACLIIRINGLATLIMSSLTTSEFQYDDYQAEFTQIADFAEECLKLGGGVTQSVKAHLTYGIGPVNPIFFSATKCRVTSVRTRLLMALRSFKVVQGLWTSCAAYGIAQQMAGIEKNLTSDELDEAGSSSSNYIRLKSVSFKSSDEITINYHKQSRDGDGEEESTSQTVMIQPCRHQTFLNRGEVVINEFGVVRGFVKPNDCECEEYYDE